jgi:hypothetical protein
MPNTAIVLRSLGLALALGAPAGCSSSGATAPQPLITATMPLNSYNGARLPYSLGPMPPKGENPGGCPILITTGALDINTTQDSFSYFYEIHNGCTQELMSRPGLFGSYVQDGRTITFTVTRTDGIVTHYTGSVTNSSVTFRSDDEVLEFTRQ